MNPRDFISPDWNPAEIFKGFEPFMDMELETPQGINKTMLMLHFIPVIEGRGSKKIQSGS